jgi:hypothetical protein
VRAGGRADAGGLVGCGGLGVLGSGDGGGFGLACSGGVLLGLLGARLGVVDLAGGIGSGGADFTVCVFAGLPDLCGGTGAGLANFRFGGGAQFGEFAFQVVHTGDRLGGGVVGLLAVSLRGVAFGLGVPAALDFFGKPGFGGGNALVGAGAGGVYLGFGRLDVAYCAQLVDSAGEGVGVLGGEFFQRVDEFGGAGDAERDGVPAGFLGALAAGFCLLSAALTVGGQRVVVGVVAVFRLGTAAAFGRGRGLGAAG